VQFLYFTFGVDETNLAVQAAKLEDESCGKPAAIEATSHFRRACAIVSPMRKTLAKICDFERLNDVSKMRLVAARR
jgi:hypothetical protein